MTTNYPTVAATIRMNKMGHLHVWRGDSEIQRISKYNFTLGEKESDLYLQDSQDIKFFLELTGEEIADMIRAGYTVRCEILSDWFKD